jgi:hypothetical protein
MSEQFTFGTTKQTVMKFDVNVINYSIMPLHVLIHECCNNRIYSIDMYEEELTIVHQLLCCRKVQYSAVIYQHTE